MEKYKVSCELYQPENSDPLVSCKISGRFPLKILKKETLNTIQKIINNGKISNGIHFLYMEVLEERDGDDHFVDIDETAVEIFDGLMRFIEATNSCTSVL